MSLAWTVACVIVGRDNQLDSAARSGSRPISEPATGPYVPNQDNSLNTGDYRSLASTSDGNTAPEIAAPQPGTATLAGGRFTIVKEHAQGGLGKVSLARDEKLKRPVALKEIRPDRRGSEELKQRFLTEAEITGQLQHLGIVPVYSLEEGSDGQPYYAMRFVEGQTLAEAIRQFHKQSTAEDAEQHGGERTA